MSNYDNIIINQPSFRNSRTSISRKIKKVLSVARAGLEVYFAAKKKDPIYLGLSLVSTYEAVDTLLAKEYESIYAKFINSGYIRVSASAEKMIFHTLLELEVPNEIIVSKDGAVESDEKIFVFNLYNVEVCIITSNNNVNYIFVKNDEEFTFAFSKLIAEKLGQFITLRSYNENYSTYLKFASIDISLENYVCQVDEVEYCKLIYKFREMGLNRSSLLSGQPGSGKTSYAAKIATLLGGKLIIIDAKALSLSDRYGWISSLEKMFHVITPAVVLFDDIDRLDTDDLSLMLSFIEALNQYKGNNKIVIMATANDLCKIPEAMKRPGRFDEIIVFNNPNFAQRKKIILTYLKYFGTFLASFYVNEMAELSEGLTPAYLREIALQAHIGSYNRIPKIIAHMKDMLEIDGEEYEEEIDEDGMSEVLNGKELMERELVALGHEAFGPNSKLKIDLKQGIVMKL